MLHSIRSRHDLLHLLIRYRALTIALATFALTASIVTADCLINKPGHARASGIVTVVSSANFRRDSIAPGSMATAFGDNLATTTEAATDTDPNAPGIQLPTTLRGTSVRVKGVAAELLYISPQQVNFIIPDGLTPSANEEDRIPVEVTSGDGGASIGAVNVSAVAPAVFTFFTEDGRDSGNPAAYLVRAKNGQVRDEALFARDAMGKLVFKPVDLGAPGQADGEHVFLVLFLSGIRKAPDLNQDGNLNESVHVRLNGFELTPSYAGPHPDFKGIEQMNVEIPPNFIGHPQLRIEITGGVPSNQAFIHLVVPPLTEAHWRASGLEGQDVHAFAILEDIVVAGATRGLFRLSEEGTFWIESPYVFPTDEKKRRALALLRVSEYQLLAGTDGLGLWYSDGAAGAWTITEFTSPLYNQRILSLAKNQRMIFAGTATNGVFRRSTAPVPDSIWRPAGLPGQTITALAVSGDRVFAGTELNGLMVSTNDGDSWAKVEGGLPADIRVLTLAVRDRTIFAGTQAGLWRSNDDGMNWTKATIPESLPINAVAADGSNLIAGSSGGGVLVSNDDGSTWKPFNDGLTNLDVSSIVNNGGRFFAGTKNGVFVTEFGGNSSQPPTADSQTVTADEDAELAIKLTGGDPEGDPIKFTIVTKPKHGYLSGGAPNLTYTPRDNYFGEDSFTFIASDFVGASAPATVTINVRPVDDPLELYVAGDENAIVGGLVVVDIQGFDADDEKVKVTATRLPQDAVFDQGGYQSRALVKWVPKSDGIYTLSFTAAEENGASVTKDFKVTVTAPGPTDGWSQVPLFIDKRVTEILVNGSTIYLGLFSVGSEVSSALARSKDNGRNWTMIGNGLPVNVYGYDIADGGAALYLACSGGLFRSTDDGTNWTNIGGGKGLPADGKTLSIAAQGDRVLAWNSTRIFISLDAGGAWTEVTGKLPTQPSGSPSVPGGQINTATVSGVAALVSLSTGILGGVPIAFRSTDNGASWQSANQGLTGSSSINKFIADGNRLYGFNATSTHYSDDHGANWQSFNPNPDDTFPAFPTDLASAVKDGLLLVLYRDGVMRISTDNGNNWSALDSIPNEPAARIAIGDLSLFAVSGRGKLFVRPRSGIKSD